MVDQDEVKVLAEWLGTVVHRHVALRLASQREGVIDREAIARMRETLFAHVRTFSGARRPTVDEVESRFDAIARSLPSREAVIEITDDMIERALDAWFKSPPSESDQGLNRSMKSALQAALAAQPRANDGAHTMTPEIQSKIDKGEYTELPPLGDSRQPRSNSVEDGAGRIGSEDCPPQKAVIDTEQSGHVPSQEVK